MDEDRIVAELLAAVRSAGVEVRLAALAAEWPGTQSGMALLRGQTILFLDANAPVPERIKLLAAALADHDLDNLYLSPAARALVEREKP